MHIQSGVQSVLPIVLLFACATGPQVSNQDVRSLLVGEWEIVPKGIYAENPDGSRSYPFGEDAMGRMIFTSTGYAANSIQRRARARCTSGTSPFQCSTEEATAAFKSAVSYQYRYTIEPDTDDPLRGRIDWKVDFVVYPNWQDQALPRRYEMAPDGNHWVLIAPLPQNPSLTLRAHLQRVAP